MSKSDQIKYQLFAVLDALHDVDGLFNMLKTTIERRICDPVIDDKLVQLDGGLGLLKLQTETLNQQVIECFKEKTTR